MMSDTNANRKDNSSFLMAFSEPRRLVKFSTGIVFASFLMVIAYVYHFMTAHPRFSDVPADWGVFGDYIGGTLGAFFGFAAFVGVLVTIGIQREQLDQVRKQAYFDELQRFLADAAGRINAMLDREIETGRVLLLQRFVNANRRVTLFSLIAGAGNVHAGMLEDQEIDQLALQAAKDDISSELPLLVGELECMAICMRRYQERGGEDDIVKLYRLRYNHLVAWLYIADLNRNPTVLSQFPIDDFVDQMNSLRKSRRSSATPASTT